MHHQSLVMLHVIYPCVQSIDIKRSDTVRSVHFCAQNAQHTSLKIVLPAIFSFGCARQGAEQARQSRDWQGYLASIVADRQWSTQSSRTLLWIEMLTTLLMRGNNQSSVSTRRQACKDTDLKNADDLGTPDTDVESPESQQASPHRAEITLDGVNPASVCYSTISDPQQQQGSTQSSHEPGALSVRGPQSLPRSAGSISSRVLTAGAGNDEMYTTYQESQGPGHGQHQDAEQQQTSFQAQGHFSHGSQQQQWPGPSGHTWAAPSSTPLQGSQQGMAQTWQTQDQLLSMFSSPQLPAPQHQQPIAGSDQRFLSQGLSTPTYRY